MAKEKETPAEEAAAHDDHPLASALAQISGLLAALLALGQTLLARVEAMARLSGVELPGDAPPAQEPPAEVEAPDPHADAKYAYAVALNHLGEEGLAKLKLTDEQEALLVAAGRAGDLETVRKLLGVT